MADSDGSPKTLQPMIDSHNRMPLVCRPKRRGYGIRDVDGEYNELGDMITICTTSPVHTEVNRILEVVENMRLAKSEALAFARAEAYVETRRLERLKTIEHLKASKQRSKEERKASKLKEEETNAKLMRELEELRIKQQLEWEELQKSMAAREPASHLAERTLTQNLDAIAHKGEAEDENLERKAAEQKKRIESEEIARKEAEQKRKAEELERRALEKQRQTERLAAEKLKEENDKLAAELQAKQRHEHIELEEKKKLQEENRRVPRKIGSAASNDSLVPSQFRGCVNFDDLQKYLKSQELLNRIRQQTNHITNTSKFYNGAIKAVAAPLNQITAQTHVKINHFTDLLEGKTVHAPGMSTNFSISHEKSGDVFVKNLLASRFVKKAEADSSENKLKRENLNYLAIVGVSLVKKFTDMEELLQAQFYRACPFLVPFSYPRNGMDMRVYAEAIGQHLSIGDNNKETLEASITQTVLDRLSGYCMLYGYMVRNMCSESVTASGKHSFFSLKEVWKILATTLSLEPQDEVTATILQSLLEILDSLLTSAYGLQYKKILKYMKEVYIEKIRSATSKGKTGSLSRLELLLEKLLR